MSYTFYGSEGVDKGSNIMDTTTIFVELYVTRQCLHTKSFITNKLGYARDETLKPDKKP